MLQKESILWNGREIRRKRPTYHVGQFKPIGVNHTRYCNETAFSYASCIRQMLAIACKYCQDIAASNIGVIKYKIFLEHSMSQLATSSKAIQSDWKYPAAEPNKTGLLQVDDNPVHKISWEEYGNPAGEPVMFLHGGPGGACEPILARFFDPDRYRVILFDQRGCGKSTPTVAADGPEVALANNTTEHLVEDIAKLREELGIDSKMHVFGGSWGSTLAMAYAIKHPDTVQSLVMRGIFTGSVENLRYMYQGNAATYAENPYGITEPGSYITYPDEWREYVEVIPPEKRGDVMAAYKEIFDMVPQNDEERALQQRAAKVWSVWEGTISNLIPQRQNVGKFEGDEFAVCFAQIEAHFFANNLFMEPDYLIKHVPDIAHIPMHIVHGRYDQVCPLVEASNLVAALKKAGAEPASFVVTTAGHSMMERENCISLTTIMDNLPLMEGFTPRKPVLVSKAEAPTTGVEDGPE